MNLILLIAADPDTVGYSGMSHDQVAADISEKRHPIRVRVGFDVFTQALADEGVLLSVVTAELDTASPAHVTAKTVSAMLDKSIASGIQTINMDSTGNNTLFSAMQSAGLMNATQLSNLAALADDFESLADQNNLPVVTAGDVQAARTL